MPAQTEFAMETEITLAVSSYDPLSVIERILSLTSLAGYALVPGRTKHIRDYYLDTPDMRVAKTGWVVRIREENERRLITLKGISAVEADGGSQRRELEAEWSPAELETALPVIAKSGVARPDAGSLSEDQHPVEILKRLGLKVIQDRTTERRVREMLSHKNGDDEPAAEMDIDSVVYEFDGRRIRHHEIEIEARSDEGRNLFRPSTDALLGEFGDSMRRWRFGKLYMGMILERLVREGLPDRAVVNEHLTPVGYDLIDSSR